MYFYSCVYPIFSTYVFLGQEIIELITEGRQGISKDWVSIFLNAMICISIFCSLVILCLLHKSIQKRSLKNFTRCFLSHYIVLIFSYCTFAIKYSRAERTKINHVSIDIVRYFYFWLFTFQFVEMADFMEKLRKEKGHPPKTRVFGVRVEKLFLIQILIAWCAFPHGSYILALGFYSLHLETIYATGRIVTSLTFIAGYLATLGFAINSCILYKGVHKESLQWIRFHFILKIILYTMYSLAHFFHDRMRRLYVPSTRNDPFYSKFDFICGRLTFLFELWVLIIYQHLLKRREAYTNYESSNAIVTNIYKGIKWENLESTTTQLIVEAHISEWKITIDETQILGEGTYAKVFRGRIRCGTFGFKTLPVAVKILKQIGLVDGDYTQALVSEIKSMLLSKHDSNLVDVYGISRYQDKPCIVMEYCPYGSLVMYLRNEQNQKKVVNRMNANVLDRWALQIANGLVFLEKMNIVHGDLAARNVLLDYNKNAKIADFGMSIRLHNYQFYAISSSFSVFPWRWMAPETLSDLKFSTQSDIWAYGVTLWEIYSFGQIPWQGFEWTSDFVSLVKQGKVLDKPCHASDLMYDSVMCRCWHVEENKRIEAKEIVAFFLESKTI